MNPYYSFGLFILSVAIGFDTHSIPNALMIFGIGLIAYGIVDKF